jgi:S-adenosylmethionine:tRNA-ribosyltransferase-isomerase (queuine synthetase)
MEIVHNGEATAQYRSEVIRALRDAGAAAVDVRLVLERQEFNPIQLVVNKASIHEEFLEYINATDPSLVDLARSIL